MNIKDCVREDIWDAIEHHYKAEDYTEALRDAGFLLKDVLQAKSGEYDKDNTKLVEAVLCGQNPVLKINSFCTQSEKDIQNGIAQGIKGIFLHVRNPISHEKITYNKKDADAILIYIDYLIRQVDKSYGVTLIDEWLPLLKDTSFTSSHEYADELIKEVPRKKTYELLEAIYDERETITKYKTKYFIQLLIQRLTSEENVMFTNKLNTDLAQTHGGDGLAMFFHFFGEKFFDNLKRVVRLRIEDIVFQGIESGWIDLDTWETKGHNAATATWAVDFIDRFEMKGKIEELLFQKAIKSEKERRYTTEYFNKHISLYNEEILHKLAPMINERISWHKGTYEFVREFIVDKSCEIYDLFEDGIKTYEEKNVEPKHRIPDEIDDDIPF